MLLESIQKIKDSINKWEQIRNTDIGLNFLTSSLGFSINRKEYESWLEQLDGDNPVDYIHLYIGVVEFEIVFYLVDSVTDKKGKCDSDSYRIGRNIFIKEATRNISSSVNISPVKDILFNSEDTFNEFPNKISEKEVMRRLFKWYLFGKNWFIADRKHGVDAACINDKAYSGIVKCMTIPFSDLRYLFDQFNQDTVFCFFAIRDEPISPLNPDAVGVDMIELILCAGDQSLNNSNELQVTLSYFADVTRPSPPFSADGFNLYDQ